MTFSNFLELINNLNQDFQFYLKFNEKELPLSKITVAHNVYLALPGQRAITKDRSLNYLEKCTIAMHLLK